MNLRTVSTEDLVTELRRRRVQAMPSPGVGDCWQDLIAHVEARRYDLVDLLPLMRERREHGLLIYGRPLQYGDGRDEHRDLWEELLDGAVYAWRLAAGRSDMEDLSMALMEYAAQVIP